MTAHPTHFLSGLAPGRVSNSSALRGDSNTKSRLLARLQGMNPLPNSKVNAYSYLTEKILGHTSDVVIGEPNDGSNNIAIGQGCTITDNDNGKAKVVYLHDYGRMLNSSWSAVKNDISKITIEKGTNRLLINPTSATMAIGYLITMARVNRDESAPPITLISSRLCLTRTGDPLIAMSNTTLAAYDNITVSFNEEDAATLALATSFESLKRTMTTTTVKPVAPAITTVSTIRSNPATEKMILPDVFGFNRGPAAPSVMTVTMTTGTLDRRITLNVPGYPPFQYTDAAVSNTAAATNFGAFITTNPTLNGIFTVVVSGSTVTLTTRVPDDVFGFAGFVNASLTAVSASWLAEGISSSRLSYADMEVLPIGPRALTFTAGTAFDIYVEMMGSSHEIGTAFLSAFLRTVAQAV